MGWHFESVFFEMDRKLIDWLNSGGQPFLRAPVCVGWRGVMMLAWGGMFVAPMGLSLLFVDYQLGDIDAEFVAVLRWLGLAAVGYLVLFFVVGGAAFVLGLTSRVVRLDVGFHLLGVVVGLLLCLDAVFA